jgi:hypothetical protein
MHRWLAQFRKMGTNFDWITAVICSFVFSMLGILGVFLPQITFSATLFVLGILSVGAFRDRVTSEKRNEMVGELVANSAALLQSNQLLSDAVDTGISQVISKPADFTWLPYIQAATQVTVVSIKHLRFLWKGGYAEALEAVLERGGTVTLVMADPRSPALWLRFQEERTLLRSRTGEAEDLARASYNLYEWKQRLIQEGRDNSRFVIKVFQNYPTQAFYKFDDNIFTYTYPYRELGYDAPMFLFADPKTSVHQFLNQSIKSLITDSVPLEDVIDDIREKNKARYFSDERVLQSGIVAVNKGKSKNK